MVVGFEPRSVTLDLLSDHRLSPDTLNLPVSQAFKKGKITPCRPGRTQLANWCLDWWHAGGGLWEREQLATDLDGVHHEIDLDVLFTADERWVR